MITKLHSKHLKQLQTLIDEIDLFNADEKVVALELIEECLSKPEQDYYNVFVYEENENVLGYHCTGQRALTDGVFDLYWIAVKPGIQNKGIGKILLEHAENFAKEKNGRLILAETSSREGYTGTRNFYIRNNYEVLSRIKDFYSVGDDLVMFGKYLKNIKE